MVEQIGPLFIMGPHEIGLCVSILMGLLRKAQCSLLPPPHQRSITCACVVGFSPRLSELTNDHVVFQLSTIDPKLTVTMCEPHLLRDEVEIAYEFPHHTFLSSKCSIPIQIVKGYNHFCGSYSMCSRDERCIL